MNGCEHVLTSSRPQEVQHLPGAKHYGSGYEVRNGLESQRTVVTSLGRLGNFFTIMISLTEACFKGVRNIGESILMKIGFKLIECP